MKHGKAPEISNYEGKFLSPPRIQSIKLHPKNNTTPAV